jgi:beta-mannosidase
MRNQPASGALLVAADALPLSSDWTMAASAPNEIAEPGQLHAHKLSWVPATVPGTVAAALQAAGRWDLDDEDDFDASDWWVRTSFEADPADAATRRVVAFGGLATLAEVWLNGRHILTSSNMFESHEVDVSEFLHARNELVLCFRSLNAAMAKRRPRPRWKTKLVKQQQLRWMRTTLLGRIPGWSPPVAAVGPWRPIALESRANGSVWDVVVRPSLDGDAGVVHVSARAAGSGDNASVLIQEVEYPLTVERVDGGVRITGTARIDRVDAWWPHTHGEPTLYQCRLRLSVDGESSETDCGSIGFRQVEVDSTNGLFQFRVNGQAVFCRGACWTTVDVVSLDAPEDELRRALTLLRDAGANMVRVGGTMVYENDAFYRLCDELGLLVWQDFMFANMDYPADDPAFLDSVRREASQQLRRLSHHACVVMYCGNSEVEQQAAMLGMPRESWRNSLFAEVLPALCGELHPGVPYVPSTPTGGALPFHTRDELAHYYGVGAYLRPFADVRAADVKFTPECLGFANVPEPELVDEIMHGDAPATHDPRWKKRTPRDTGAGWDFEDVRDHYLRELFGVDPARLRYADTRRYLDLGRVTTGEAMARAFSEWRSAESRCGGALVWFYRDLWPGAGWGIADSRGIPKACYWYLRRCWQPLALAITDEGLNGVCLHVVNERREPWSGTLELTLLRDGATVVAERERAVTIDAGTRTAIAAEGLLGGFYDTAYAYRFGAPSFDIVAAALRDGSGEYVSRAVHFPVPFDPRPAANTVSAVASSDADGWLLTIRASRFLYAARLDVPGFAPSDNYTHVLPGRDTRIRLRATGDAPPPRGFLEALNLSAPVRIEVVA